MQQAPTYSRRVAAEVRACLARDGMTQQQLADGAGFAKATLSRKLSGVGVLTLDEIQRIAPVLGVSVLELLRRAEDAA